MKIKCLVTECDVTAGKFYEADHINDFGTAWVTSDDVGEDYPLLIGEYEVVA